MRFTKLNDWLDWQSTLHLKSIDLGLERVSSVWKKLHPKKLSSFVITVAGTNGKGSSTAMFESILIAAGFSVGCYTSPHLVRYNERHRINGSEVDDHSLCQAFSAIDDARGDISLSYFEFATLASLYLFAQEKLDVIVLEVGLGGRLDAVNIIDTDAALITSIDLDHQDWLGSDRESIGFEKAGIFRANKPAFYAGQDIPLSIIEHAEKLGANLKIADRDFHYIQHDNSWDFISDLGNRYALPFPILRGQHQFENAAGVIALLMDCRDSLAVSSEAIRHGLLTSQVQGRFQVIQDKCTVIIDVAHNEQAMKALTSNLSNFHQNGRLHVIIGMLKDKDIQNTLKCLIPFVDRWHLVPTEGERGLSAEALKIEILKLSSEAKTQIYDNVIESYHSVVKYTLNSDTILVTGSFLIAGTCLEILA